MSQSDLFNPADTLDELLRGMDTIRPLVLQSRADDPELRSLTRRMVSDLERMRQNPGIPMARYQWLAGLLARFLDAEHGALIRGQAGSEIEDGERDAIQRHAEQRQQILIQALQDMPAAEQAVLACFRALGQQPQGEAGLSERLRMLLRILKAHLSSDASLNHEVRQLIGAIQPSLESISELLAEAGEASPELQQARELLEKDLPEDVEEARRMLQQAREGILKAGNHLASASASLRRTMQQHLQELSSLSDRLQQAETEARNDPLTGLANRRHLAEFLKGLNGKPFGFLIVDIDHFKQINDRYGHDAGDEILRQLAAILRESTRSTDLPARIGGEEFCVVFPESNLEISRRLAESLRQAIESHPFQTRYGHLDVTASIGVACHDGSCSHAETFKAADRALYQAKHHGRNRVEVAGDMPSE